MNDPTIRPDFAVLFAKMDAALSGDATRIEAIFVSQGFEKPTIKKPRRGRNKYEQRAAERNTKRIRAGDNLSEMWEPHRCGARNRSYTKRIARGDFPGNPSCLRWAVPGRARCWLHGGLSTGAKTPEGKARQIAAMVAGRRLWVERIKVEGKKFPCGRRGVNRMQ